MTPEQAFTARLKSALDAAGIDEKDLPELLEAGTGTVWGWLHEGVVPNGKALLRLPKVLGVNGHWLLTGEEPVTPPGAQQSERISKLSAAAAVINTQTRIKALLEELRDQFAATSPAKDADSDTPARAGVALNKRGQAVPGTVSRGKPRSRQKKDAG